VNDLFLIQQNSLRVVHITLPLWNGNIQCKSNVNEKDTMKNNMKHLIVVRHFGCPHRHQRPN